jgi:hypothetical protein
MRSVKRLLAFAATAIAVTLFCSPPAMSGSHTWVINEIYSNADGTLQFVEMWTSFQNEWAIGGKSVHTDADTSDIFPFNLPMNSTSNKHLLLATAGFAVLPGAPTPDLTIPSNFFNINGDTIQWHVYAASILSFGPGDLPTDGIQSLNEDGTTGSATPTNFADATFAPPGVRRVRVAKVLPSFPDGSRITVTFDDSACIGAADYHIVYGLGSQLPTVLGGTYMLQPAGLGQCGITGSPKTWSEVPDPIVDATRFLYFLVLAGNGGSVEGSWGFDIAGNERSGAMGGASGQCSYTTKVITNGCP